MEGSRGEDWHCRAQAFSGLGSVIGSGSGYDRRGFSCHDEYRFAGGCSGSGREACR